MRIFHYNGGVACLLFCAAALSAADATVVLRNGRIWTGDPQHPWVEAIAILGNKIDWMGTNDDVLSRTGKNTQVIDLAGKRVVPGFNDAHVHFFDGGSNLSGVQLRDAKSQSEFRDRIGVFANDGTFFAAIA